MGQTCVSRGGVLFASSAGGHFDELEIVARRQDVARERRSWVVPRTPQTATLDRRQESVAWVPKVDSRDLSGAMRNLGRAIALQRRLRPSVVVSTGAAQAAPHLLAGALLGARVQFVESAARCDGPSVTGRLAAALPRAELLTSHRGWGGRWAWAPDVFSAFEVVRGEPRSVRSAVVALGSERYPFNRAVKLVQSALDASQVSITWQVGSTHPSDGISLNHWLQPDDLALAMCVSDVVVVHGGAGSILTALSSGRVPIVVPRSSARGEHVDDHQIAMCRSLADRDLVVMVSPGESIEQHHLDRATARSVLPAGTWDGHEAAAERTEPA